jgi:hypothetical protein
VAPSRSANCALARLAARRPQQQPEPELELAATTKRGGKGKRGLAKPLSLGAPGEGDRATPRLLWSAASRRRSRQYLLRGAAVAVHQPLLPGCTTRAGAAAEGREPAGACAQEAQLASGLAWGAKAAAGPDSTRPAPNQPPQTSHREAGGRPRIQPFLALPAHKLQIPRAPAGGHPRSSQV